MGAPTSVRYKPIIQLHQN